MEEFWNCIASGAKLVPVQNNDDDSDDEEANLVKKAQEEKLKQLNTIFLEHIRVGCKALANYFAKDSPKNVEKFYEDPEDCYDGLYFNSDVAMETVQAYIMLGKDKFDEFCKNPFDGDILKYTERAPSCGNSSCLYILHPTKKRWYDIVGSSIYEAYDCDFLNEIHDIAIDPYFY